MHSSRSDGAAAPSEIARAAREAGLDFLILTDHHDFDSLGTDRYDEGVLLIKGVEISTDGGHVVALDIPNPEFRFDGDTRTVLSDVRSLGGFAIAAHPFSLNPERLWADLGVRSFDGIEIVNWADRESTVSFGYVSGALAALLNRRYGLLRALQRFESNLDYWDNLTLEREVVGVAAADAHGGLRIGRGRFLRFPDYRDAFEMWRNHVVLEKPLSGDVKEDRRLVLDAIRAGRLYVAVDGLAFAGGFRFRGDASGLEIEAPDEPVEMVLRRGGVEVARTRSAKLSFTPREPGAYRVEVFWRGANSPVDPSIPWILSNPIYVGVPERPHDLIASKEAPPDGVLVEDFERALPPGWRTVADAFSRVSPPRIDPATGAEGSTSSIVFDFTLGKRQGAEERSHVSLETAAPLGVTAARGLSFYCRATGVFRFDVQLRDKNPRAAGGVESWRKSVKTSTEWQPVFLSWDELKSYHNRSDGRFDPGQAQELTFYLDTATVRAGLSGRIWIDRLRLESR